jgi:hypothetical protein
MIGLGLAVLALLLLARIAAPAGVGLMAVDALLVAAGVATGILMRRCLAHRREQAAGEVATLLSGARSREALSMTLSLQVDEVVNKCKLMDEMKSSWV